MDFDEVVKRRKMIREYDSKRQQIPNEIITNLIRNAHRAPSAGHTQVQEFIIVKDTSIKKRLYFATREVLNYQFSLAFHG